MPFKQVKSGMLNITIVEWVILIFLFILGCLFCFRYASGPKYWDDLLYINTAWNMNKVAGIDNRYSTIFLLPIFNFFAKGDPLIGAKFYGVFSFMTINLLVYINARLIAKSNKIIVGILSVLLMLTFTSFVEDLGVVLADNTVTMMMLLGVFVYLLLLQRKVSLQFG